MRRGEKSLRIGVHRADAVVMGTGVRKRTRLTSSVHLLVDAPARPAGRRRGRCRSVSNVKSAASFGSASAKPRAGVGCGTDAHEPSGPRPRRSSASSASSSASSSAALARRGPERLVVQHEPPLAPTPGRRRRQRRRRRQQRPRSQRRRGQAASHEPEGRSIQANVGVELKGVSWS